MQFSVGAQISEIAKELLGERKTDVVKEINSDSLRRADSISMSELALQLQEMKLNEILLRSELDEAKNVLLSDSSKQAIQRQQIDSLRLNTKGVPVVVEQDTLFFIYAKRGGVSAADRAEQTIEMIMNIGTSTKIKVDSVYLFTSDHATDIMSGDKVIFSVTNEDAMWQNSQRAELAEKYMGVIYTKLQEIRAEHSLMQLLKRILYFVIVIALQYALFVITSKLFRKLKRRIIRYQSTNLKPIYLHDYEFLSSQKQARILIFFSIIARWGVILLQLMVSVPILFAIFPKTEDLARRIISYMLEPVKMIFGSVISYIPNLFIVFAIYFSIKYIIKGVQYLANEIESSKLVITGFYADWAQPTSNIIRFLLYAFMIAMIYPYLPGASTGVFQGISVFVGLIVSLGSTTVIGNIIAGLVITYMRPFKLGDRIKLNDTTGNVIEKTPFVTRICTPKNEIITIPNSFIMSSHTTNYTASARNYGLIIHSTVTIGYDAPWRKVHELLIDAARSTEGVSADPAPFVLETELSDFYPVYQINAYITNADNLARIYSELHQNIQDKFNEAGVEIMSPHYRSERDGNDSTIPESYRKSAK